MGITEITNDMIGREVTQKRWHDWAIVKAVIGDKCWITVISEKKGSFEGIYDRKNDWILKDLPAPKKKPSERINEFILELRKLLIADLGNVSDLEIHFMALVKYLDEQAQKEQSLD